MNANKGYYLCVDFGSQSIRAKLINQKGESICHTSLDNFKYLHPKTLLNEQLVEQDSDWFYQVFLTACQRLMKQAESLGIEACDIYCLSITTMRNTVFSLDENGKQTGNAILWWDKRLATKLPKLAWYWRLILNVASFFAIAKISNVKDSIIQLQKEAFVNHIHQYEPQRLKNTKHWLLLSGYLNFRLTGRFVDAKASVISHLPINFKNGKMRSRFSWYSQAFAIKKTWLPRLVNTGSEIGRINETNAKCFFGENTPVIAAAADKACEVLGAGCIEQGDVHISLGSAISICAVNKKFKGHKAFYPAYPSAINELYLTEIMIANGMISLTKYIKAHNDKFKALVPQEPLPNNIRLESLIEKHIVDNEIVARETVFDLKNAEKYNDVFAGFSHKDVAPFQGYVAIIDAIVDAIFNSYQQISKRVAMNTGYIVVTGGGANSDLLLQKLSNKLQVTIEKPKNIDAGTLGVAMICAVSLKHYNNYDDAKLNMVKYHKRIIPQ